MKIWVDDTRPRPSGYDVHTKSVIEARAYILGNWNSIDVIDLDHDAGDFAVKGGDYIRILEWLERFVIENPSYKVHWKFRIHSMNPVGKENMLAIIENNDWKYEE